jgi:hypothetical protein
MGLHHLDESSEKRRHIEIWLGNATVWSFLPLFSTAFQPTHAAHFYEGIITEVCCVDNFSFKCS